MWDVGFSKCMLMSNFLRRLKRFWYKTNALIARNDIAIRTPRMENIVTTIDRLETVLVFVVDSAVKYGERATSFD